MGCCNSKNKKVEDIKQRNKSDNGKLNESKVVLNDSLKDDISQRKDDKIVRSQKNDSFGKQEERSKLSNKSFIGQDNEQSNYQIDESNNQSVKDGKNETESSNGKLKSETKSEISLQNTNNSSDSDSNETYTITEQKSKYKGVSYIINVRPINKKKQTIKTKESKQSKYEANLKIDISILFPKRKNDSKSSMDSSDELSISTENNEQTDKRKSKSSTKSDNGKLNESKVVLSDSSKEDLSQGKDDKTVMSQNNSSLSKQKEKSELSNKSLIGSDNGQVNNQSNTESEDDSSIEPQSDQEIRSNTKSNNRSIKGSDNEQGNKSTTELDINTPDINHSIQGSDNEEENEPKTESDDDSSIALENEPENRQNTDSDNQELSDNDDESLVTTHSPIFNRDQSLEEQVNEWKSLIETLTSNKKLTSYALAKSRTDFNSVSEVADYLEDCEEAKSVTEKAWLVYVWITHNIAFDVQSFLIGDFQFCKPQSVLKRGLAVYAGYTQLYKELCEHLGIKCIIISGISKGYKVREYVRSEDSDSSAEGYYRHENRWKSILQDHEWNAIALGSDGKLRFIESTWGAGHIFKNRK